MLKLEQVSKLFGNTLILDEVSLNIEEGSLVGLAGPSGSGKSTLLRCIQKLEKPDAGEIHCEGRTSFMFQDFQLFPHMTVLENLTYAPLLKEKARINILHKAQEMLQNLGIASKASEYPKSLSGGQKQRVALARSLMMNPDILLCDEPTSGLDVATTLDVVSLLKFVRKTMIIASHDLDFLTKLCDRIILLKGGKIVVDISPKKMQDPVYHLKNFY